MNASKNTFSSLLKIIILSSYVFIVLNNITLAQEVHENEEAQNGQVSANQEAVMAWQAYDYAVRAAHVEYETKMHSWREAMEAYNQSNGELPHPGPMPREIDIPPTPPMPRP